MPLAYDTLLSWPFEEIDEEYTEKDTMLYALGLGLGDEPTDAGQLRFVYEDGLSALPTMAVVLGYPGLYLRDPATGVDWKQMLHGEQGLVVHKPLAPSGRVVSTNRIDAVVDKGPGRGALVYSSREQRDAATGEPIVTLTSTAFCRADGGFGGPGGPIRPVHAVPERAPGSRGLQKDAAAVRADLPVMRRSQPDPRRPRRCGGGRLRASDSPRPLHLRDRGLLRARRALRRRGRPPEAARRTLLGAGAARRRDRDSDLAQRKRTRRVSLRVPERDAVVLDNGYAEFEE